MKHAIVAIFVTVSAVGCAKSSGSSDEQASSKALASSWASSNRALYNTDIDLTVSPPIFSDSGAGAGPVCDYPITLDTSVSPPTMTIGAATIRAGTGSASDCTYTWPAGPNFTYSLSGTTLTLVPLPGNGSHDEIYN